MQLPWHSPPDVSNYPSPAIDVGNLARTYQNLCPHYHVIAVSEGGLWVRDLRCGIDQILPIARYSGIC